MMTKSIARSFALLIAVVTLLAVTILLLYRVAAYGTPALVTFVVSIGSICYIARIRLVRMLLLRSEEQ
jgi:hypothetical protein